jgi:multidrug efflux pump subunit AcrA (membrane-fusion protein)
MPVDVVPAQGRGDISRYGGGPIQVRTPAIVERPESVVGSGSVEGSESADVAFQGSGRVARVLVEEGRNVSKGQLLAELEPTDYRNAFNAASAPGSGHNAAILYSNVLHAMLTPALADRRIVETARKIHQRAISRITRPRCITRIVNPRFRPPPWLSNI